MRLLQARPKAVRMLAALALAVAAFAIAAAPAGAHKGVKPNRIGLIDCNGHSPKQKTLRSTMACSDPRSIEDGLPSRFEDNDIYVGHDEPIVRFLSSRPGSGNDITWTETLPRDPAGLPTVRRPGHDRTHWFELSVAPWFSMAICDARSYPQSPCTPQSDRNAPHHPPHFDQGGGGSAFMEMQFYPPGYAPFVDNISCDNTHWCAALTIDSLECTLGFSSCNNNCIEPVNFAFIQTNGVPTGPPSPQLATTQSVTPNRQTLLMNPGDHLRIHIWDAHLPGGGRALENEIVDLTTGQRGYMIASAKNGFMNTSIADCSGHPFNFQPEYSTAKPQNIIPWAALETNISTEFEIGHFTPCTKVLFPQQVNLGTFVDTQWQTCVGPYEAGDVGEGGPESTDAPCYPKGFTHAGMAPPNLVSGCDDFNAGGDLDYDGTSYWPDWPNSLTARRFPSPFLQQQPATRGRSYAQIQFQTDAAASESTCQPTGQGCMVPPAGPGHFYPYWTQARVGSQCVWEFGQMPNGNTFGGTKQYGSPSAYFFGNLEGPIMRTPTCAS